MTIQKALDILSNYGVPQEEPQLKEALDIAIKSLGLCVPTKAKNLRKFGSDTSIGNCPNCGAEVCDLKFTTHTCKRCGQLVDMEIE